MKKRITTARVFSVLFCFLLSMVCVSFPALTAWALDLNPGKYEVTVKMEMPGMQTAMPAQTMVQCMTEQDPVPRASADAEGCKVTDMNTRGNTVTYTIVCEQQGTKTESTGEVTFSGDTFEGKSTTKMGPAAGGMSVTVRMKGKRIGSCP
jgi:hypothetical protein